MVIVVLTHLKFSWVAKLLMELMFWTPTDLVFSQPCIFLQMMYHLPCFLLVLIQSSLSWCRICFPFLCQTQDLALVLFGLKLLCLIHSSGRIGFIFLVWLIDWFDFCCLRVFLKKTNLYLFQFREYCLQCHIKRPKKLPSCPHSRTFPEYLLFAL